METSVIALSGQTVQRQRQRVGSPSPGLSVPLLSGQTVQPCSPAALKASTYSFQSPCYRVRQCNWNQVGYQVRNQILSVPLLSGQTVQLRFYNLCNLAVSGFQSPCYRVRQCNPGNRAHGSPGKEDSFSPLVIGSDSATRSKPISASGAIVFQSPCYRVRQCNSVGICSGRSSCSSFSPLVIGSDSATSGRR